MEENEFCIDGSITIYDGVFWGVSSLWGSFDTTHFSYHNNCVRLIQGYAFNPNISPFQPNCVNFFILVLFTIVCN